MNSNNNVKMIDFEMYFTFTSFLFISVSNTYYFSDILPIKILIRKHFSELFNLLVACSYQLYFYATFSLLYY